MSQMVVAFAHGTADIDAWASGFVVAALIANIAS
jgi:hypothetical protein